MEVSANNFDRLWEECKNDYIAAVAQVGESGWYILGRQVDAFEKDLAAWCGRNTAVGCGNGMDAMEIALRAAGIGCGDRVLTTPLSAFATGLAILRTGAEPAYCDTDEHGLLDPDAAEAALAADSSIRAIIPVHLYGQLADMPRFTAMAAARGITVIEDAAQAIGARRGGRGVGADGHPVAFSFYPTKNLGAIGDGGALLPAHADMDELARSIRNYGQSERYVHEIVGLNSRLDELHAATLRLAFLPRLESWLDRRREIAAAYLSGIDTPHVTLIPGPDPKAAGWHLFPVLVAPERRAALLNHLKQNGIQGGLHYPVLIPEQKAMTDRGAPVIHGTLSNARRFAQGEVSLPIHPYLTEAEVNHVVETVKDWNG
ncbi:DegT/DnrJ/EryC1/StrS family aminotransferase [Rhodobacteraceae bacterium F11138]|nr:DegT/DnrJ/EryC1/StrS family aminotransferase [Rhodobacteraceae bacterium F11138]